MTNNFHSNVAAIEKSAKTEAKRIGKYFDDAIELLRQTDNKCYQGNVIKKIIEKFSQGGGHKTYIYD